MTAKILIVDDDEKVTTLLKRFLSSEGYQVTVINQSSKTIQTADALLPDLFILDIMMPPPDGFTLCRMLRADPKFTQTPILIITALDNSNSKATAFGADDYLVKPFNFDELTARIESLLGITD
jgi:DNA-binding response OmpR family regulator